MSNMLAGWKRLGLPSMPTEKEAIRLARMTTSFFDKLFEDEMALLDFKCLYSDMSEVWAEVQSED
jgi:hypothetical protein